MMKEDDVALNFGEEEEFQKRKIFKHPLAVGFHLLFRILAIIAYLLCGLFSSSFIASFVVIILLLSMDFWTVKNITGRLLVGLRWWNSIDEEGKSHWIYEKRKNTPKSDASSSEARIFWLSLVGVEIIWVVFFFATLFSLKLKWMMVVLVGLILNGANLYGYLRCKVGTRQKLSSMASNFFGQQMLKNMFSKSTDNTSSGNTNQDSSQS